MLIFSIKDTSAVARRIVRGKANGFKVGLGQGLEGVLVGGLKHCSQTFWKLKVTLKRKILWLFPRFTDVSRKVTFPERRFPERRFPERRFPDSHFPGKTFPG